MRRGARFLLGVEPDEVVSKTIHGSAKYPVEDLKKRKCDQRKMIMERVEQSQKKQKRCYDLRNRVKRCEDFTVDDTVLLKNFRARDEKYVGSYLIVDVRDTRCEIES